MDEEQQEKRSGGKRGKQAKKKEPEQREVFQSTTDPDAGMMGRPGKPKGFHYLAHMTVEPTHGIILDIDATPADISDHEPYVECIRRTQRRHTISEAAADAGYDYPEVHKGLSTLEVTGYIPSYERRSGSDTGERFRVSDFAYDAACDTYTCPHAKALHFTYVNTAKRKKVYAAKTADCKACPMRESCVSPSMSFRTLQRPLLQQYVDEAHARIGSPRYHELLRLRRIWCEGTFALLKARHCLRRAMRRGLENMREQVLMAATAVNIRRLVSARI